METLDPIRYFKRVLFRVLPKRTIVFLKKIYYPHILKYYNLQSEIDIVAMKYLIKPHDYVVDVGSSIGLYTKWLSEFVGPGGHVYAIEPVPVSYDILASNIRKLRLTNVELMWCAISDFDGNVEVAVPSEAGIEDYYQAHIIRDKEKVHPEASKFIAPAKRLDSLFDSLRHKIAFIKIDVEGYELDCVRGAIGIIENSKPAWLIEVTNNLDDPHSKGHEMAEIFREKGYGCYWFDGIRLRSRKSGDKSVNYFFLLAEHLSHLNKECAPLAD